MRPAEPHVMPKPKKRRDNRTHTDDVDNDRCADQREAPPEPTDSPLSAFSSPVQVEALPYQPPLFESDASDDTELLPPSQIQSPEAGDPCFSDTDTEKDSCIGDRSEACAATDAAKNSDEDSVVAPGKPQPGGWIYLVYPTDNKNTPHPTDPTYMRYCVSQYDTFQKMQQLYKDAFIYFRHFYSPEHSGKRLWACRDNFHWPYIDGREDLPPGSDESKWLKEPAYRICLFEGLFSAPCKCSGMDNSVEPTTLFFLAHPQRVPARTFLKVLFPNIKPLFIRELNWDFLSDNLVPLVRKGWMDHFPLCVSADAGNEAGSDIKAHTTPDAFNHAEPKKRKPQQRAVAPAAISSIKRKPT